MAKNPENFKLIANQPAFSTETFLHAKTGPVVRREHLKPLDRHPMSVTGFLVIFARQNLRSPILSYHGDTSF